MTKKYDGAGFIFFLLLFCLPVGYSGQNMDFDTVDYSYEKTFGRAEGDIFIDKHSRLISYDKGTKAISSAYSYNSLDRGHTHLSSQIIPEAIRFHGNYRIIDIGIDTDNLYMLRSRRDTDDPQTYVDKYDIDHNYQSSTNLYDYSFDYGLPVFMLVNSTGNYYIKFENNSSLFIFQHGQRDHIGTVDLDLQHNETSNIIISNDIIYTYSDGYIFEYSQSGQYITNISLSPFTDTSLIDPDTSFKVYQDLILISTYRGVMIIKNGKLKELINLRVNNEYVAGMDIEPRTGDIYIGIIREMMRSDGLGGEYQTSSGIFKYHRIVSTNRDGNTPIILIVSIFIFIALVGSKVRKNLAGNKTLKPLQIPIRPTKTSEGTFTICISCGSRIDQGDKFCMECGMYLL